MATNNWFLKLADTQVCHLRCDSSDHCPLHVTFSDLISPSNKKLFRFEEMWLSNAGYEEIVQLVWNITGESDSKMDLIAKVDKCGRDLTW